MADTEVRLDWTGDGLAFRGHAGGEGPELVFDGDGKLGPSPMQTLLGSVAACMAIDVVMILQKSRVPLDRLAIEVEADRAESQPRRFTAMTLVYRVEGPAEEHADKLQRAVDLSREKYCSVLHTLRPDLDLEIRIERA